MLGIGQSILEEGREEGREEGMELGIQALVLGHMEECIPRDRSIVKLQKFFGLTQEKAEQYYEKYAAGACVAE